MLLGDAVGSPEMRLGNGDNNNGIDVNNPVADTCSVHSSGHCIETSRVADDNDLSNVANNNNRIEAITDAEGTVLSTSISLCANDTGAISLNSSGFYCFV